MIAAIVCMSANRVIGKDNKMPWHLPADLNRVKQLTSGHIILMGRKTFHSIGRPLPNRRNVILTSATEQQFPGCEVVHSVEEALTLQSAEQTLFIFGGSTIYEQFLPHIETIYKTVIHEQMQGDTFFPELDEQAWTVVERVQGPRDEKNPYDYEFMTLVRRRYTGHK